MGKLRTFWNLSPRCCPAQIKSITAQPQNGRLNVTDLKKDWIEHLIVCLIGLVKPAKFGRRHIGEAKVLSSLLAEAANKQWTVDEESNFCALRCIKRF